MSFDAAPPGGRTGRGGQAVPWEVVALGGEIDLVTAPVVLEAILAAGGAGGVVVDFADVDIVGVAAVNALVEARHQLRSAAGEGIVIRSPTRLLSVMLDLFGLADLLEGGAGHELRCCAC